MCQMCFCHRPAENFEVVKSPHSWIKILQQSEDSDVMRGELSCLHPRLPLSHQLCICLFHWQSVSHCGGGGPCPHLPVLAWQPLPLAGVETSRLRSGSAAHVCCKVIDSLSSTKLFENWHLESFCFCYKSAGNSYSVYPVHTGWTCFPFWVPTLCSKRQLLVNILTSGRPNPRKKWNQIGSFHCMSNFVRRSYLCFFVPWQIPHTWDSHATAEVSLWQRSGQMPQVLNCCTRHEKTGVDCSLCRQDKMSLLASTFPMVRRKSSIFAICRGRIFNEALPLILFLKIVSLWLWHNFRSALKKIVERDDTPCKRLVLCVADIKSIGDSGEVSREQGGYQSRNLSENPLTSEAFQIQRHRNLCRISPFWGFVSDLLLVDTKIPVVEDLVYWYSLFR